MYKIALCDDEFITANYYYEQIAQIFHSLNVECSIDLFTDSGKLLAALYGEKRWDIYFLDVDMPLINGLDLGKKIRELDWSCYLIYISIHRESVYDSLANKPFRFIPKDEFHSKIRPCIQSLLEERQAETESSILLLETRTALYRCRIGDILYIQSLDKYITLYLTDETRTEAIRYKMSDLEKRLKSQGFLRIHKSYLVNYRFISSIQPSCIILDNGAKLPVSRYRLDEIKTEFRRLTL